MPTDTNQTAPPAPLMTIGDVARRFGITKRVVDYAIEQYRIEPVQRAGIIRLYSAEQLPTLAAAVRRTASRRSR